MNCEFCQSPVHIWFQCPKKPDGWKPARLAKRSTERKNKPVANGDAPAVSLGPEDRASGAKQAVDTSRVRKKALAGEVPSVNEHPETEGKLVQVQQSHSANKFDKKAWQREYMREYMRKRRANVGTRTAP